MNTQRGLTIDAFWDSSFWEFLTAITPVAGGAVIGLGTALFLTWRNNRRTDLLWDRDQRRADKLRWQSETREIATDMITICNNIMVKSNVFQKTSAEDYTDREAEQLLAFTNEYGEKLDELDQLRNALRLVGSEAVATLGSHLFDSTKDLIVADIPAMNDARDVVRIELGMFISMVRVDLGVNANTNPRSFERRSKKAKK
ncbi:hypothetical protein MT356_09460 [Rathayibacter festucae]|uniref:hypothetical protein n=1 Tax=Rathayibacter festucae TaxID=110937 RepID=UPI001FB4E5A7|nr:hypothetical protein [Rathayibacter festucae]MCJ1699949.1 hypothetical protein [Rathayibacter festucae]